MVIDEKNGILQCIDGWKIAAEARIEKTSFGIIVHSLRKFYDNPYAILKIMKYIKQKYPTFYCWTNLETDSRLNEIYSRIGEPIGIFYKIDTHNKEK